MRCLFCGVDCEGDGPEAVVMGALGVAEAKFAGFSEFGSFGVELGVEVGVVGYVEEVPQFSVGSLFDLAALGSGGAH